MLETIVDTINGDSVMFIFYIYIYIYVLFICNIYSSTRWFLHIHNHSVITIMNRILQRIFIDYIVLA